VEEDRWAWMLAEQLCKTTYCQGGFETRPHMYSIGALPRGPRLLCQGGFETRPYRNPAASRPVLLLCIWSKLAHHVIRCAAALAPALTFSAIAAHWKSEL